MTTDATIDSSPSIDRQSRQSMTRRRALTTIGAAGAALVAPAATVSTAHTAGRRFRFKALSPNGTTLWTAAFSPDAHLKQVRSDGAHDTIRSTYHETGERLTTVTAYTRRGRDVFKFYGKPSDFRYLDVAYYTGDRPKFWLNRRRIGPFGSWETASPEGAGPSPY